MRTTARLKHAIALLISAAAVLLPARSALAVPAFARQTGLECAECHIVGFSVLTPFGRKFKLNAYTEGERDLPLTVGGVASATKSRSATPVDGAPFTDDNRVVVQRVSAYLAGKITDNAGGFVNWNYDGVERRGAMEMVDVRYADTFSFAGKPLVLGVTLNNNPTVSDVFNSTPAFGYPQVSPAAATVVPTAMTQVDMALSSQVAGLGVYGWWGDMLYGELGAYRTADGIFSVLRAGVPRGQGMGNAAAIKSGAPYYRLALEQRWGQRGQQHSLEVGVFGLNVDRYPDPTNPNGPTDRYRDYAADAQYQYLSDEHRVTSGLTWIKEKRDWRASFDPMVMQNGMPSNPDGTLTTSRAHVSYMFRKRYGGTVGYFSTKGSSDATLYTTGAGMGDPVTNSANGSPDNAGTQWEVFYIPQQNIRLALRYTNYSKFNGAASNYDGSGRNAKDNNTTYLYAWFLY